MEISLIIETNLYYGPPSLSSFLNIFIAFLMANVERDIEDRA